MADPFVIHILGDLALFDGALNGIAMLFKSTDLLSGNGYLGLGFGAFFGAAILLCIMVYNAAFKQQMDIKTLLAPLIVYIILTMPKVDVAVSDVYTGQVRKIDNVPIGLAIPASVASGISKILTNIFETAYQTVSPNELYMPRITSDGFVTPLKLINNLRIVADGTPSPLLLETSKNFYQRCLYNNAGFNTSELSKSTDPLEFVIAAASNAGTGTSGGGVVNVASMANNGTIIRTNMSCENAAKAIRDNIYAYVDGIALTNSSATNMMGDTSKYNLRKALAEQMIVDGGTGGTSNQASKIELTGQGYGSTEVFNSLVYLAKITESDARKFVASTLFNPILKTASHCTEKYGSMTQLSKCTAWVSSINQWEEKNAAAGTGFLKIMKDGQNILIMISFLLFPIIVIFVMVQGTASFKILGNYMAFTVAAYLWLPMASIINFYIQSTLTDEFYKVSMANGGIKELNMVTGPQFYAAVSQKLALANGLLASVPVLSMMLFSGMMMGMGALTSRMNSADAGNYDAKVNSPDIMKSAPMASSNSAISGDGAGNFKLAGGATQSINLSNSASVSNSSNQTLSENINKATESGQTVLKAVGAELAKRNTSSASLTNTDASQQAAVRGSATQHTHGTTENTQANAGEGTAVNKGGVHTNADGTVNTSGTTTSASVGGTATPPKPVKGTDGKPQLDPKTGKPVMTDRFNPQASGAKTYANTAADVRSGTEANTLQTVDNNAAQISSSKNIQDLYNKVTNNGTNFNVSTSEMESLTKAINQDETFKKAITATDESRQAWGTLQSSLSSIDQIRTQQSSFTSQLGHTASTINSLTNRNPEGYDSVNKAINNFSPSQKAEFDSQYDKYRAQMNVTGELQSDEKGQDRVARVLAARDLGGEAGNAATAFLGGRSAPEAPKNIPSFDPNKLRNEVEEKTGGVEQKMIEHGVGNLSQVHVPQANHLNNSALDIAAKNAGKLPENFVNPSKPKDLPTQEQPKASGATDPNSLYRDVVGTTQQERDRHFDRRQ